MWMTRKSDEEKRRAWMYTVCGLVIGIVLLCILGSIGFPSNLWTPTSGRDFFRAFLTAALIVCGALVLFGPMTSLEDQEVRDHAAGPFRHQAIINPVSGGLGALAGLGLIAAVVLVFRYLYLLIF